MSNLTADEYESGLSLNDKRIQLLANHAAAFFISTLCSGICAATAYKAAGVSMGLFIGTFLLLALGCPALIAAEKGVLNNLWCGVGLVVGASLVWFRAAAVSTLPVGMILSCIGVLAATVFAMIGLVNLLKGFVGPIAAGALTAAVFLAWLTWPIWLSPALHKEKGDQIAAILVAAHPIFVCNGVLFEIFDNWAQQPMSYNITSMGDDINFTVPRTIWKCVFIHAGIGIIAMILTLLSRRRAMQSIV